MIRSLALLLFTAACSQARELMTRKCFGTLSRHKVLMETDLMGTPLMPGDTVSSLPYLRKVQAWRAGMNKTSPNSALARDLGQKGNVLIINNDGSTPNIRPNGKGGVIRFGFNQTAHQLINIRVLGIGKKKSFVRRDNSASRTPLVPGMATTKLKNWYKVKKFSLILKEAASVAEITFTTCQKFGPCPAGQVRRGKNCQKCPGDTIKADKKTCKPCPDGMSSNVERTQCIPRKTTKPTEAPIPTTMAPKTTTTTMMVPTTPSSEFVRLTNSEVPTSSRATYSCEFINRWNRRDHPVGYPSSAHWSPPFLIAHDQAYSLWKEGEMATRGAQILAEFGGTSGVTTEAEQASYTNYLTGRGQFNRRRQKQTLPSITLRNELPLVSSMTMIAPSPDWFTGLSAFDMRNTATNTWYEKVEIDTFPYDAGTDSGTMYTSANLPTNPAVPIFELTKSTVTSQNLLPSDGGDILPMATWRCTLEMYESGRI